MLNALSRSKWLILACKFFRGMDMRGVLIGIWKQRVICGTSKHPTGQSVCFPVLTEARLISPRSADPPLRFIAHLPTSIYGEQLIAQLLRLVPDRGWLFRYGRVSMNYVMHDFVWEVCHGGYPVMPF